MRERSGDVSDHPLSAPSPAVARRPSTGVQVLAVSGIGARRRPDALVTEEPMEIRLQSSSGEEPQPLVVTMRTPGNDFELAAGFCRTEGIVTRIDDVSRIAYCLGDEGEQLYNVVTVRLQAPSLDTFRARAFLSNSSCGVCGKAALDEVELQVAPVRDGTVVSQRVISSLPERLARHQRIFSRTGGLHAAARFTRDGVLLAAREDVGRHNALDKLIGHALLERCLPLDEEILLVSGRLSFELVQKAAVAGIPILCAVSAPSSLAVAAAERFNQTLVAFLRDGRFNIYSHPERIELGAAVPTRPEG
jgi:FdhD protein